MKLKVIISAKYSVLGVIDGEECPAEDFINIGESTTEALRAGLFEIIRIIAESGFGAVSPWSKVADKQNEIYELKKGKLRLFYFKGFNGHIAICTTGVMKSTKKADKASVRKAISYKEEYMRAIRECSIVLVEDDDEN